MHNKLIEVEIRCRVTDRQAASILKKHSIYYKSVEHDEYFKFRSNPENNWIIRIRNKENQHLLTFKGMTKTEGAWNEAEARITESEANNLRSFFLSNNFVVDVKIKKIRKSFNIDDFTINIDSINQLGVFIEIEKMTTISNIKIAKKEIEKLLIGLGLTNIEYIHTGYVQLMKKEINGKK
jgi:predicted adenylyl cyclase CyaB